MKQSLKTMMVAAAVSGLLSGATVMHASVLSSSSTTPILKAGKLSFSGTTLDKAPKHSCKGKNDCKGQGGCKSSDNGCKQKNSCKG
ncbi:MAG: hypothetical protein WA891_11155, partial [Acidobacteriaceae bacterium]